MPKVVGVRFKQAGKIYYFDPEVWQVSRGDEVIVETSRGQEYGTVVVPLQEVGEDEVVQPLKKVVRTANNKDRERVEENRRREKEALRICAGKIQEHGLEMKLVDAEYTFDRNRVIIFFTADGRVDFRELVKDLAGTLKTRIELRQVGVRDEAKILGGLGPCGRALCCCSFLDDFQPVSIRMAKQQNLSLNPSKISGICGRLMCCLRFECGTYEDAKAGYPPNGARVETPRGEGKVTTVNVVKGTVQVELANGGGDAQFSLQEVGWREGNGGTCCKRSARS
ncbi:MAG: stage 0 sporulation family protein [Firmicutes bacterium]|nr:stage 0 sporulation family protein [Bacillota bacterium]